jgi:hypothetical protein
MVTYFIMYCGSWIFRYRVNAADYIAIAFHRRIQLLPLIVGLPGFPYLAA